MAPPQEGNFREVLKDILVQKDELETHLQTALEAAATKDDFNKLSTTLKKLVKMFEEMKIDSEKRAATLGMETMTITVKPDHPNSEPVPAKPISVTKPTGAVVAAVEIKTAGAVSPESAVVAGISRSPEQHVQTSSLKTYQDYVKNRKDPKIYPDSQRIYLGGLDYTVTEEDIFYCFTSMGFTVVDVKVFGGGTIANGIVGLSNLADVAHLLLTVNKIQMKHGSRLVSLKQFISKEARLNPGYADGAPYGNGFNHNGGAVYHGNRAQQPVASLGGSYRVFCGGIPLRASIDDVTAVLEQYGKVRNIVMPTEAARYGSTMHRKFAYVDFENPDAAQKVFAMKRIKIAGEMVECKFNTKHPAAMESILREPAFRGPSSSGSKANLTTLSASLPQIPYNTRTQKGAGDGPVTQGWNDKEDNCILCKKNPKDCVILWCGDTETCMDCGKGLKKCPKADCNKVVTRIQCVAEMSNRVDDA